MASDWLALIVYHFWPFAGLRDTGIVQHGSIFIYLKKLQRSVIASIKDNNTNQCLI